MGLFATILGSKQIINNVSKGVDKAIYTSEEKAEMVKRLHDEYTPRAITRRFIALIFCVNFSIAFQAALWLAVFGKFEKVKSIIEVVRVFQIGWIIVTIVIFFFGYYGVKACISEYKK